MRRDALAEAPAVEKIPKSKKLYHMHRKGYGT